MQRQCLFWGSTFFHFQHSLIFQLHAKNSFISRGILLCTSQLSLPKAPQILQHLGWSRERRWQGKKPCQGRKKILEIQGHTCDKASIHIWYQNHKVFQQLYSLWTAIQYSQCIPLKFFHGMSPSTFCNIIPFFFLNLLLSS